jgi:hypothetical protein
MGMQGGPQPQLPMTTALQRSEEDIMEIVRRVREIKKVELDLADAAIPSET